MPFISILSVRMGRRKGGLGWGGGGGSLDGKYTNQKHCYSLGFPINSLATGRLLPLTTVPYKGCTSYDLKPLKNQCNLEIW